MGILSKLLAMQSITFTLKCFKHWPTHELNNGKTVTYDVAYVYDVISIQHVTVIAATASHVCFLKGITRKYYSRILQSLLLPAVPR